MRVWCFGQRNQNAFGAPRTRTVMPTTGMAEMALLESRVECALRVDTAIFNP